MDVNGYYYIITHQSYLGILIFVTRERLFVVYRFAKYIFLCMSSKYFTLVFFKRNWSLNDAVVRHKQTYLTQESSLCVFVLSLKLEPSQGTVSLISIYLYNKAIKYIWIWIYTWFCIWPSVQYVLGGLRNSRARATGIQRANTLSIPQYTEVSFRSIWKHQPHWAAAPIP